MSEALLVTALAGTLALLIWWLWREPVARQDRHGLPLSPELPRHDRERVLFLCTRNSARSQMAEALLRARAAEWLEVGSAGTEPAAVHPLAVRVMGELGIDIAHHRARSVDAAGVHWTYVITVCDAANERCPEFPPKTSRLHWSVPHPAAVNGTPDEQLMAFRQTRDTLRRRIDEWIADRGIVC